MGDKTEIAWTDATWNPTSGCSRVSEGCRHCYIERTPPFRMAGRKLGDPVQLHPDRLDAPFHWRKPRRVFVNSLSDLFHRDIPDVYIDHVFAVMKMTAHHTYQVLTKRPARMLAYIKSRTPVRGEMFSWAMYDHVNRFANIASGWPLPNVHLGVSVEDQQTADERIPILLETPAAVRFLSAEPLLGPVNLREVNPFDDFHTDALDTPDPSCRLNWVIVGGESGPKARPCDLAWIRSIVQQCKAAATPVFVKQLGARPIDSTPLPIDPKATPAQQEILNAYNANQTQRQLERIKDRKGSDPSEWPADLRVREWPQSP